VASGQVKVNAADGSTRVLVPGDQVLLSTHGIQAQPTQNTAAIASWRDGWLDFQGVPLAEAIDRLARYSPQNLYVAPEVAQLPVLGRVRIQDTSAWLRLLPGTLPVRVERTASGDVRILGRG
jgi:ferric-dicitrate binding protein FerR (iron transport regulator)